MSCCSAFGCSNRASDDNKKKGISFHKFPLSRPTLVQKWVQAVRREKWQPTRFSCLCSEHFTAFDFLENYVWRHQLREDAVPSIFKFPAHLQMADEYTSVAGSVISDSCSVIGCLSRPFHSNSVSFHRVPTNALTRMLWTQTLKLDPTESMEKAVVCSDHFDPCCFKRRGDTVELFEGSIPAITPKRKVRPSPNYVDEEVPSKKQRTEIKVEPGSADPEVVSPSDNCEQTVLVSETDRVEDETVEDELASSPLRAAVSREFRDKHTVSKSSSEYITVKKENAENSNFVTSNAIFNSKNAVISAEERVASKVSKLGESETKTVRRETSGNQSKPTKGGARQIIAPDEEVVQWAKEVESVGKQAVPTVVPPASHLTVPIVCAPANGTSRRYASKLSQCMNEEGDDKQYIISKINFAMMFIQTYDRQIKELNDRYVELTRKNEELREEENLLIARLESAKLRVQTKTVAPPQSVSQTVTLVQHVRVATTLVPTTIIVPTRLVPISNIVKQNISDISTIAVNASRTCAAADVQPLTAVLNNTVITRAGNVIVIGKKDATIQLRG